MLQAGQAEVHLGDDGGHVFIRVQLTRWQYSLFSGSAKLLLVCSLLIAEVVIYVSPDMAIVI